MTYIVSLILLFSPDTFRVMSEDAVSDHPKYKPLPYRASFEPRTPTPKAKAADKDPLPDILPIDSLRPLKSTRVLPQSLLDYRAHRPQAKACGFLDRNVRFLNEPVCNVSRGIFISIMLSNIKTRKSKM